jgi:molecular chaperone DnaJ
VQSSCYQALVRDPYEILGVGRDATEAQIKSAFRRLALEHHPDKNPDDPEASLRFKEINAAHQILSDPNKRAAYDRFGASAFQPGGRAGADYVDLGGLDEIFGDILGAFGLKNGDRGTIKKTLDITFEESAHGTTKEISYERLDTCEGCQGRGAAPGARVETCSACNGRGRVRFQQALLPIAVERPCSRCRGTGAIPSARCVRCDGAGVAKVERTLRVDIPAGIESGASRIVNGAGNKLEPHRGPGDLEILVAVTPHAFFKRSGDDVVCGVPITLTQAALGGEIEVPTLEGKVKLRVPPSTQPGTTLRIRGRGFPKRLRSSRGDQLVEVAVEVPERLSERARTLFEELGRELGEEVQPQQRTFLERLKGWL